MRGLHRRPARAGSAPPTGSSDLAEREHADGFWALPGHARCPARGRTGCATEDRRRSGPLTVGRKGRAATARPAGSRRPKATTRWKARRGRPDQACQGRDVPAAKQRRRARRRGSRGRAAAPHRTARSARSSARPRACSGRAAVWWALRGVAPEPPAPRRRAVRRPTGCCAAATRRGAAVDRGHGRRARRRADAGLGRGPGRGRCAVVREAVVFDPLRAVAGSPRRPAASAAGIVRRHRGSPGRRDGAALRHDGTLRRQRAPALVADAARARMPRAAAPDPGRARVTARGDDGQCRCAGEQLARFSLCAGTPPSPVAITTWRQPWVPLWLEWRVALTGTDGPGRLVARRTST